MDVRYPPFFFSMPHLIYNSWLNLNTIQNAPKLAQFQLQSMRATLNSKPVKKENEVDQEEGKEVEAKSKDDTVPKVDIVNSDVKTDREEEKQVEENDVSF
ncbi:hypothetical protein B9Z55_018916 [Caenorhabditis nigoni]|uniref:Uncharacterized protein n=1 Tax=Caenorhabditis nigoni TaxID=1611254 RepID=A0A2G5TG41_9PELO|nr:hypothetical protein B9Z55_018916 [Caenorhabditis nigoni]